MTNDLDTDQLKKECWEKRFFSFGTAQLFERRVRHLGWKRRTIIFLGFATPIFIGAYVTTYNAESQVLKNILLPIVGVVSIVQFLVSFWSLVARWDENYAYAVSSVKVNTRLTADFQQLATAPRETLIRDIERLRFEYDRQSEDDSAQEITPEEKRFGQRSALFQYGSTCPICAQIPKSMAPSDCDSCGNF